MRRRILLSLLLAIVMISSCGCANGDASRDITSPVEQTTPTLSPERLNSNLFEGELELETEFEQIEVYAEQDVYSLDTTEFYCRVINHNKGHGFWLCRMMYIEKYVGNQWNSVKIKNEYLPQESDWAFCAIENSPDTAFATTLMFRSIFLEETLNEGTYRFVVFIGDTVHYANFKVGGN